MLTPASPNDTVYVTDGATIVDAEGNGWFIENGQVVEAVTDSSGNETTVVDTGTANVVAIAYVNGLIWQLNAAGLWWAKTGGQGSYDGWTSGPGTDNAHGTPMSPLPPSPSGTVITASTSIFMPVPPINPSPLVDASGNLFWISGSGQVVENGVVDTKTANVIEMAYVNGVIWQENAQDLWWAKTGGPGSYDGWTSGPGTDNANGTYTPPVPIALTWVGGGTNEASNPADWNIPVVPGPGDELLMNGGTMNVAGNVLAGDTVTFVGNPDLDTAPPSFTLNLSGDVAMSTGDSAEAFGAATINLADHSHWVGSINAGPYGGGVTVDATGDGTGTFSNVYSYINNQVTIDANVVGTGMFMVSASHSDTKLEFMHPVGAGQSMLVTGGYSGASTVQIDSPHAFHASVSLGDGVLFLAGLEATSYSLANGILSLFNGHSVVDTMKLSLVTTGEYQAADFAVTQSSAGVTVYGDAGPNDTGFLPVHT